MEDWAEIRRLHYGEKLTVGRLRSNRRARVLMNQPCRRRRRRSMSSFFPLHGNLSWCCPETAGRSLLVVVASNTTAYHSDTPCLPITPGTCALFVIRATHYS